MVNRTGSFQQSKYFRINEVVDGVYAAVSKTGSGSLGNAAIINLGDATLIVDTSMSINAANQLKEVAKLLTGQPVKYVVNTHWHGDHTFGNQVFSSSAQIISTATTRFFMDKFMRKRLNHHLANPEVIYKAITELSKKIELEKNDKLKNEMQWEVENNNEYITMLPHLKYTLPSVTFENELIIHGSKRTVKLLSYGGGHTQSDAFVFLHEERIAIMGDLVLSKHHPVLMFANPKEWLRILDQVETLGIKIIVPGHGEICSMNELYEVKNYIKYMLTIVELMIQNNQSIDDFGVPKEFESWYFTEEFKSNLQVLYQTTKENIIDN